MKRGRGLPIKKVIAKWLEHRTHNRTVSYSNPAVIYIVIFANIKSTNSSGCGLVGRAVASNTRGSRFESSHWQKFIYILNIYLLSTVYWKDENKEKIGRVWPIFFKKKVQIAIV